MAVGRADAGRGGPWAVPTGEEGGLWRWRRDAWEPGEVATIVRSHVARSCGRLADAADVADVTFGGSGGV